MGGVVPEFTRKLYDLAVAGRWPQARSLQMQLTQLFDRVVGADFPDGVRAAVDLRGFQFGPSRQPVANGSERDQYDLALLIQRLLSD
jgi:4-hydroxy-tetrahydrodipicolinate synthase